MEIIICSDNHGLTKPLEKILETFPNADAYIHCGDVELDTRYVEKFHTVAGNNDYFTNLPSELFIEVGDIKIMIIHGHQYFSNREEELSRRALNNHCQIACYGHTHIYKEAYVNGVLCINPGSLRYNRDNSEPCFARIVVREDKSFEITRIDVKSL